MNSSDTDTMEFEEILYTVFPNDIRGDFRKRLLECRHEASVSEFGIRDDEVPVTTVEEGTGIISNNTGYPLIIHGVDKGFKLSFKKLNNLSSGCDLMMIANNASHLVLAELSETTSQFLEDFIRENGSVKIGKREKARRQLINTIKLLFSNNTTASAFVGSKKWAVFFNRFPNTRNTHANRMLRAFNQRAVARNVTHWSESQLPDWAFMSVPYPHRFELG